MPDLHDVDMLVPPTYEPSGETQDIVEAIRSGSWLNVVNVWVWRTMPHLEVLFQQRDANSPFAPNLLDCSSGGYLMAGEAALDGGRRELKEELGIEASETDFIDFGRHFNAGLDEKGRERKRVISSFGLEWNHELADLHMDVSEVPAAFWVSTTALLGIEHSGSINIEGMDYEGKPIKRTVTNADFVYNVDRLHYRICEQIEHLVNKRGGL